MIESTKRKPDYMNDINTYGKLGEDVFLKLFEGKRKIRDVRKEEKYQRMDIDFLMENDK